MDNKFISKFLKGSAFSSIGTLFTIVFHFLSIKLLAEFMPRTEFGMYSIIIVVSHGIQIMGSLGLNLTLVKNLSGEIEGDRKVIVTSIFLARGLQLIGLGVLVFLFGHLVLPLFFESITRAHIVYIPFIFVLASGRELLFHLLQGHQLFNRYALIHIFSALIRLASILFFYVSSQITIENMLWVEIVTYGVSTVALLIFSPFFSLLTTRLDLNTFKRIFSFSAPLYANDLLTYVYNRVSVLLVGGLLTPLSVAMYEMATKIPDGFGRLFNSLIVVYFPSMSELLGANRLDEGRRFMNRGLVLASAALAFAALVTFLFRDEIVVLLFSDQYLEASMALALLMVSFNLNSVARMMGYTIVAAGHSSIPVRINFVSSLINIVGCLALIPRFGYIGAVYASIAMNFIAQGLNFFYLTKSQLRPEMWGIVKSTLIMALLLAGYFGWGNEALWVKGAVIVSYIGLCWLTIPEMKQTAQYASRYVSRLKWLPSRSV